MDSNKNTDQVTALPLFIREVGRYFMEFLETDFHKRKLPKRSIKLHNAKGLLTGVNVGKYPSFYRVAHKLLEVSFSDGLGAVQKGVYKADIPQTLLDLIARQISNIGEDSITSVIKELDEAVKQASIKHSDDYLEAYNSVIVEAGSIFKKHIILGLVKSIEKPLEGAKLSDENAIFQIEEELSAILVSKAEDAISESLKTIFGGEKANVKKSLKGVLDLEDIRASLIKFFEMFKIADIFNDLHELYQNSKIEDKQEFYLYFCDITYQKNKYPIFYIPFSVDRKGDEFLVSFDSQIYINKKALAYIAQEHHLERGKKGVLTTITDRIIYLADHERDLPLKLQETLTELTSFFGLDHPISISASEAQTSKSLYITLSTNIYLALFDKSDEALLNDYEDILNAADDSPLMLGFEHLIDDFIHRNPEDIQGFIKEAWGEKSVEERLVYKSPIPLNAEQQQILTAINDDRCSYTLVEGPPGTGKSHTITAIAFNAILDGKSVLILSDKKEALDVVEKNIVNTLNKVRVDEKFQNPILRLGKTGNNFSQLLTQTSIDEIDAQFHAVKSRFPNLDEKIGSSMASLQSDVEQQVGAYRKISLQDINELTALKEHFDSEEFCIDIDEAIDNPDSVETLSRVRSILISLKGKVGANSNATFNVDITHELTEENAARLAKILDLLEKIQQLRTTHPRLFEAVTLKARLDLVQTGELDVDAFARYERILAEVARILEGHTEFVTLIGLDSRALSNIATIQEILALPVALKDILDKVRYFAQGDLRALSVFKESHREDAEHIERYLASARGLRRGVFGYLGRKQEIDELNRDFRKHFASATIAEPHKHLKDLEAVLRIHRYISDFELALPSVGSVNNDIVRLITALLRDEAVYFNADELSKLAGAAEQLSGYAVTSEWLAGNSAGITTLDDIREVLTIVETNRLYDQLAALLAAESDFLKRNLDLKQASGIEAVLKPDNLENLIAGITSCSASVDMLLAVRDDMAYLQSSSAQHKSSFAVAGIAIDDFASLHENRLTGMSDLEFEKLVRYISLSQQLNDEFAGIEDLEYRDRSKQIENIVTMQMTYLMDERFIDFTRTYKNDIRALKKLISEKRRFPKDQFAKLKIAFPCILAGIRDYAEYIPLEPGVFDLVIIDEASQVSIAQAFPALLRAKKVVVLGDNLQFSNVKSALARGDINKQHLASLRDVFLKNVATEADKIVRLEKFNIKTSILDFFESINNYKARLVKHFRGYRELISYSNQYFYQGKLQVMKVRGVPIGTVLKFSQIEHDGLEEETKNTNLPEVEFIISELLQLKEQGKQLTVGVITPHTNQQQLLYEKISNLPEAEYLFDTLKLKIMTFDTCQGEEMDLIIYSMVATLADDKLNYIFITNLDSIDKDDDDGKIKAQRLNVGLSRAKECMHFVLSKPIDQYTGTAREFLQHYATALAEGQRELDSSAVDSNSKMEPLVLEWFYQTAFWKENKDTAEIIPQFELGKYLKQLDRTYDHPKYRVDFLLVYVDEAGESHKIIIEYDGFLEHFGNARGVVTAANYEEYYSSEDVYRQHVLEGYGYRFLRINRFNLGGNPIETLDARIQEIVKKKYIAMVS